MNHHEEAPKLSKLPFIVGDAVLIATAFAIAAVSATPLSLGALITMTVCIVLGAALLVIPFLTDYARRQDAELTERQSQISALARITSESAEQIGIVAAGLHTIADASKHRLDSLENLPAKVQERLDEHTRQLTTFTRSTQSALNDDLARLETAVETLTRIMPRLETTVAGKNKAVSASEATLAATLTRATAHIDRLIALAAATRPAETPHTEDPVAPPPAAEAPAPPAPPPEPESVNVAPVEPAPPPAFTASEPTPDEVPVSAPEPAKPSRTRKPKASDSGFDLGLVPDASESGESSMTSDGFTRLIATAYIGIGNKLYLRGEGPGLTWEKGVVLQFVSIGKWRWETPDATAPLKVKLYKNDQIECPGLGTLTLEPGRQHEVNAGF